MMDDGVAFIIMVGGVLAVAALVLFILNCIEKRQRRNEQQDVVTGAAVVAAVGVAAIALSILDRASVPRQNHGGGSPAADKPECAFCLGELEDGEQWVVLTRCHHEFHRKCLAKWLANKKTTCPICRAVVWPGVMRDTPADMV